MSDDGDRRWLDAAIRLGCGGLGTTWPNPAVGAILLKDNNVLGRGRTAPGGRPHGEIVALAQAGEPARGATLYVSLEPCSHHGRTPPCADALIEAGVARVVSAMEDPNPLVVGRGHARLRDRGIEVSTLRTTDVRRAHVGHVAKVLRSRPHVCLKLAVSRDDAIGRAGERQAAVTGEIARRHVQALRSRFDAILVGRGTVEADDPELTCRLPGLEWRSPVRVVLDSDGRLGPGFRVFNDAAPTWVLQARGPESKTGRLRRLAVAPGTAGGLDIRSALERLAAEGITRVLVEGGAKTARAFLEADLADEVLLFRSPVALGGELVPALDGLPLSAIEASERFRRIERRRFGPDMLTRYERVL
jgi:diaminohydroxyphosphoribosylaminopyrimidine deaminase/5-amino-6-(5-phosphoribosylamino)uracil reductase